MFYYRSKAQSATESGFNPVIKCIRKGGALKFNAATHFTHVKGKNYFRDIIYVMQHKFKNKQIIQVREKV